MSQIPIYLKNEPDAPRPEDPEFFWLTRDGWFLGRNHPFFQSDVPTSRAPAWLADHKASCSVHFPKVPASVLEYAVGFLGRAFDVHGSESIVLLVLNTLRQRYKLLIPSQEASVWHSSSGYRTALDVTYQVPLHLPRHYLLVGDIHSHGDYGAYASGVDKRDETYRDGIHIVVGRIDEEPPEFHVEMSVDGHRFPLKFDDVLAGYRQRRRLVPERWLRRLHVIVKRPAWTSYSNSYTTIDASGRSSYRGSQHDTYPSRGRSDNYGPKC